MARSTAHSSEDPGSLDEQSRRKFLANATVAVGGVIGLVLTVPLVGSLIPETLLAPGTDAGGTWATLPSDQFAALAGTPGTPVKLSFDFKYADGYFVPAEHGEFLWGVQLSEAQAESFKAKRPDLFDNPAGAVRYDAVVKPKGSSVAFVMFSSICPHLGCRVEWNAPRHPDRFFCPCHGSEYSAEGQKLAGPAPRGLDPLPFRDANGTAQVTWIHYKSGQPDRVIVSYT